MSYLIFILEGINKDSFGLWILLNLYKNVFLRSIIEIFIFIIFTKTFLVSYLFGNLLLNNFLSPKFDDDGLYEGYTVLYFLFHGEYFLRTVFPTRT